MTTGQTFVLLAGHVLDPGSGSLLERRTVIVQDGLVTGVLAGHDGHDLPPDARKVDLRDLTLLPALVDAHVHLTMGGDGRGAEEVAATSAAELSSRATSSAKRALAAGITTVRDVGSVGTTVLDARASARRAGLVLPRILAAGAPVTTTRGHCWFFGGEADGVDSVRDRVRALVAQGVDWIKVMGTGGGTVGTAPWLPSYSQAELDAIVTEARRLGRKVTVHCLSSRAISMAVQAGADQIEHAGFAVGSGGVSHFDPAVADQLASAGVVITPTLSVRQFEMRFHEGHPASPERDALVARWRIRLENGLAQFRRLHAAGVAFVAGTDAGWLHTPFDGLSEEIALIAECGPSALDALRSATTVPAGLFELPAATGTLATDSPADLLAVRGDPLRDLRALGSARWVMRGGLPVPPDAAPRLEGTP